MSLWWDPQTWFSFCFPFKTTNKGGISTKDTPLPIVFFQSAVGCSGAPGCSRPSLLRHELRHGEHADPAHQAGQTGTSYRAVLGVGQTYGTACRRMSRSFAIKFTEFCRHELAAATLGYDSLDLRRAQKANLLDLLGFAGISQTPGWKIEGLSACLRNKTFALKSGDFQSPTFYGEHEDGTVKCLRPGEKVRRLTSQRTFPRNPSTEFPIFPGLCYFKVFFPGQGLRVNLTS